MPPITPEQRIQLHAALDACLDDPNMDQGNFDEIRSFLAAPWTTSAMPLGYVENLELRLPLLEQLRDMQFQVLPKGDQPLRTIRCHHWTPNVWAALMVADYRKLTVFVQECLDGIHGYLDVTGFLDSLHSHTETIIDVGLFPRRITASRSSTAASTPVKLPSEMTPPKKSQSATSTPTRAMPGDTSTPMGKRQAIEPLSQMTPSKKRAGLLAHSPSTATMNPPSFSSPTGALEPSPGKSPETKEGQQNKTSKDKTHERDNGRCTVLKSLEPEVIHVLPWASIKYADMMLGALGPFERIWPDQEFYDCVQVLLGEKGILDSPKNMISMDHKLHHGIDKGHIGLEPIAATTNSVTLRLRILPSSKLSPKNKGRTAWALNPAQNPHDILIPRTEQYNPEMEMEQRLRFVHSETQRPVKDGHQFTISTKDPDLLPDIRLLRMQWRIACMANLTGRDGDEEHEFLEGADGDPDQQTAPMAGDFEDLIDDDNISDYMLPSDHDGSS